MSARLVINSADLSSKLKDFSLSCGKCSSRDVTLDIDWAAYPSASWMSVTVVCEECKHEEEIFDRS